MQYYIAEGINFSNNKEEIIFTSKCLNPIFEGKDLEIIKVAVKPVSNTFLKFEYRKIEVKEAHVFKGNSSGFIGIDDIDAEYIYHHTANCEYFCMKFDRDGNLTKTERMENDFEIKFFKEYFLVKNDNEKVQFEDENSPKFGNYIPFYYALTADGALVIEVDREDDQLDDHFDDYAFKLSKDSVAYLISLLPEYRRGLIK